MVFKNSSKFVTNNSDKTRHVIYSRQQSLHQHNRLNRDRTLLFFFLPGVDASRVYVRASTVILVHEPFGGR